MADEPGVEVTNVDANGSSPDYAELTQAVRDLVQVMQQGELERLEVSQGDLRILLCARPSVVTRVAPDTPAPGQLATASDEPESTTADGDFHYVTSPMVGTFYEAPAPGEQPFVHPGDNIEVGQTVAIIEAMKIMNEIVADRAGVIDAVLVENGETVEYGHPIFRIRPV